MKHVYRLSIILGISFLGELLNQWIPLPVPAGIYGLILMLIGLCTGIVPLEKVRGTGRFLIEIMPVMFIPAGVGLMTSWETLRAIIVPVSVITVITIITVMIATGWVSQVMIRRAKKAEGMKDGE